MQPLQSAVAVENDPEALQEASSNNVLAPLAAERDDILPEHAPAARTEIAQKLEGAGVKREKEGGDREREEGRGRKRKCV